VRGDRGLAIREGEEGLVSKKSKLATGSSGIIRTKQFKKKGSKYSLAQVGLRDVVLKIAQCRGIDVELPLQVGVHCSFHLLDLPECKHALANNAPQLVRIGRRS